MGGRKSRRCSHPDRARHGFDCRARASGAAPGRVFIRFRSKRGEWSTIRQESERDESYKKVSCRNNISMSIATVLLAASLAPAVFAQMNNGVMSPPANTRPPRLENVGIEQHLNAQVPPDLIFRDECGRVVKLGDYFGRKPLILNLVYYNCTMLCGEALAGLASALRLVKFDVGNKFEQITVSFNPQETPQLAAEK